MRQKMIKTASKILPYCVFFKKLNREKTNKIYEIIIKKIILLMKIKFFTVKPMTLKTCQTNIAWQTNQRETINETIQ
jgi:hypothetical protein